MSDRDHIPQRNPAPIPQPALQQVMRRVVGIGLILAGVRLIDFSYWWGIAVMSVGFAFLFWELCTEPELLGLPTWIQISCLAVCLLIFDVLTIGLIKAEAPFTDYSYSSMNAAHPDKVTDLRLSLTNESDDDYKDIDMNIYPDTWVHIATCQKCSIEPLPRVGGVCFSHLKAGAQEPQAINTGGETECQDDVGDVFQFVAYGPNPGFRLQCAKLSARDTVQVVLELVTIKKDNELPIRQKTEEQPYDPRKPDTPGGRAMEVFGSKSEFDLFGQRPIPATIYVSGRYKRNRQPFSLKRAARVLRAN